MAMSDDMDMEEGGTIKKFMFVNRKAPYGTIYALESLEVVLISAAFEQDVSLAFLDDGVYQLMKNINTEGIEMKSFSKTYRALEGYDIERGRPGGGRPGGEHRRDGRPDERAGRGPQLLIGEHEHAAYR
jgi:hypothetical protein